MKNSNSFEAGPRPERVLIGYSELAEVLQRSAGGLKTMARTLPFRRWKCSRVVVFDRAEVEAYLASKQH